MKYIEMLYKKYSSTKVQKDECSLTDFKKWLKEYQKDGQKYLEFLGSMGIEYYHNIVELNKGAYDTLISTNINGMIVTPYLSSFDENNTENVIGGKLLVTSAGQIVIPTGTLFNKHKIVLSKEHIYICHNPNGLSLLKSFLQLKRNDIEICIGVFGKKSDNDRCSKIDLIDLYNRSLFNNNSQKKFDVVDGTYMYAITNKKSK